MDGSGFGLGDPAGLIPVALAGALIEILVAPELVDLLARDLEQGIGFITTKCGGVILVSMLQFVTTRSASRSWPRSAKLRLASAAIAAWFAFLRSLTGASQLDLQIHSIAYGSILGTYRRAGAPVAGAMTGAVALPGGLAPPALNRPFDCARRCCCVLRIVSRNCTCRQGQDQTREGE